MRLDFNSRLIQTSLSRLIARCERNSYQGRLAENLERGFRLKGRRAARRNH